jgi:hypothetical protein
MLIHQVLQVQMTMTMSHTSLLILSNLELMSPHCWIWKDWECHDKFRDAKGIQILQDLDLLTKTFSPMDRGQKMKYKVGSYQEGHCSHDIVWDFSCPILILLSDLNSKALTWGCTGILEGGAHYIFMFKAPSLTEFQSALKLPSDLCRQR